VAIDSAPLEGAARVEDTINLLAHAARKVVDCAAGLVHWTPERVCQEARVPLLLAPSIKAALDRDWSDPVQKETAVKRLVIELQNLNDWLAAKLPEELEKPPLCEEVATLKQIMSQYPPANRPEDEAVPDLSADITRQGLTIDELYIDRGYVKSPLVDEMLGRGAEIVCRPWVPRNGKAFPKAAFKLSMRELTITCPAGETERIRSGSVVEFAPEACDRCHLRAACTAAEMGTGRSVNIAEDERLQQRLRKHLATPRGRARLRERVAIEHKLAHVVRRQRRRARYRGVRKNVFDLRRASVIQNLEVIHLKVAS